MGAFFIETTSGQVATAQQLVEAGLASDPDGPGPPWHKIRATGDATRFSLLVEQYKLAPDVTRKRLWLETVQQVLSENRKIVGGDSRQLLYVPMADKRGAAGAAPLLTPDVISPAISADPATDAGRPARTARPGREEERR